MKLLIAAAFAGVLAFALSAGAAAAGNSCENLTSLELTAGRIGSATPVAPGVFQPPGGGRGSENGYSGLPAFCRVTATLTPSSDSDIKVEVWLPSSGWNNKLQAVGNGGWAGTIGYSALAAALSRGYVAVA